MRCLRLSILLAALITITDVTALNGQIILKGKVTTDRDEPVVFANVLLRPLRDTTKFVEVVVADMQGDYRFRKHREGKYLLTIQSTGFKVFNDTVNLRKQSIGRSNEILKNYIIRSEAVEIENIVVVGNNVTQHFDRTVYTISNADRKRAVTSLDLTAKIPQVSIDRINETIATNEGAVTILVNGIASSEQELKTISPEEVNNIEYYDLPPIRYGSDNKVLNIITKVLKEGIYGGVDLRNAVPVKWLNDSFYLRYNRGRSQISFRYYASYHTSNNQSASDEYKYSLNNVNYDQVQNIGAGYKSFYNDFNLKYTNQLQDKYVFQATFYPSLRSYSNHSDSQISFFEDEIKSDRYGTGKSESEIFNPILDLYLWKQFGHKQEMILTFTGNYYNTYFDGYTNEYELPDNQAVFEDFLKIDGNKYSAIGQALYIKNFKKLTLSFGNRFSYEANKAQATNLFGSKRELTTILNNYFAGEVTGKIGESFSYRFTLGLIGNHTAAAGNNQWQWIFSPKIIAGYQVSPSFIIKAGFSQFNTPPKIGMLNDRIAFINQNIISRGNPSLKNGYANSAFIGTGYNNKWLNVSVNINYGYAKDPINYYYLKDGQYIALTPVNDKWRRNYTLNYALLFTPFMDNLLSLKLQGGFNYVELESDALGLLSHFQTPLSYEIAFNFKNLSVFYQGNVITSKLSPPLITLNRLTSNIGIRYRYKDFAFSVNCTNFLIQPQDNVHTINGSEVWRKSTGTQKDTYNMIILGFSYHFGKGREYKEKERQINNVDEDSGL